MKRLFAAAAVIVGLTGCTSKLVVRPVGGTNPPVSDDGVFYALPKTVLLVQIPVVRTQLVLGEFSELVPVFFPFEDPPIPEISYSLDEPTLSSFGVPDSENVFLAIVKGGRFEDKKLALNFGEDGTLEKIDAESNNRTLEFVGQVIRSAAAIGGKVIGASGMFSVKSVEPSLTGETPPAMSADCQEVENLLKAGATTPSDSFPGTAAAACNEIAGGAIQAAMRDFIRKETDVTKRAGRARTFLRARAAADRLIELRKDRDRVLAGSGGSNSGDPLKTALETLDAEIEQIMGQFFGRQVKKTYWRAAFQLTPTKAFTRDVTAIRLELFTFSPNGGVCQAAAEDTPVVGRLEQLPPPARTATCTNAVKVEVIIRRSEQQYADVVAAGVANPPAGERGLFYRVPGKAHVILQTTKAADNSTTALAQYSPAVGQFGPVVSLPATSGGRKTHYLAELHSATGAMRSFTLGSDAAIDKTIVSDIEAGATSLLDAREKRADAEQKRRDEAAAASDELTKLKREADILETQLRIKAAQDKLAGGKTPPE